MIRLVLLLLTISALSLGLSWVADEPGQVTIDWGVFQLQLSLLALIALVALFALGCMCLYWVCFTLLRSPRLWHQARNAKRQSLGITALTETFAAIATQDVRHARKYLRRAESLLPDQPLTLMLASQVARLEGNDSQAQLFLERMSKSEVTEFMALRGLIDNARRAGDATLALQHAEKAYAIKPHDHWLATVLIGIYAKAGRLHDALKVIERAGRKRVLSANEVHELRSGVLHEAAKALIVLRQWDSAIQKLQEALRRNPKFIPAIVLMAEAHIGKGDISMGLKIAGDAWKRMAHPDITAALLRCFDATKDKPKASKLLRKLAKLRPATKEAQILMACLAMKEKDTQSASGILRQWIKTSGETSRLCSLLADMEDASGNSEQAAIWHKRAKEAPAELLWNCSFCKRPAAQWDFACMQCGAVGAIH